MNLNRKKYSQHQNAQILAARQQGFVLILVLVLLAALTLIGVSSMNNSSMELKATGNARQHQVAFNAVQSLLEYSVSTRAPVLIDFQTTSLVPQTVNHPDAATLQAKAPLTASAVYAGCASGIGSSLEEGKGFSNNYFNITGTGTNATGTASSTQVQGIRFPAAACN